MRYYGILTQVVLNPLNQNDFCPMFLLLLLAVAKDLEDFFKTADETYPTPASARKFFHGLLDRPDWEVQLHTLYVCIILKYDC